MTARQYAFGKLAQLFAAINETTPADRYITVKEVDGASALLAESFKAIMDEYDRRHLEELCNARVTRM